MKRCKLRPEVVEAIRYAVKSRLGSLQSGLNPEIVLNEISEYVVTLLELPEEDRAEFYEP